MHLGNACMNRFGFTLVELLVTIAIVGLISLLLTNAIQASRESARNLQCQSNLRQIGLAVHNYDSARHSYPTAMPSWIAQISPYMELDTQEPGAKSLIDFPKLLCPSDSTELMPYRNYQGNERQRQNYYASVGYHPFENGGFDGPFVIDLFNNPAKKIAPKDITDGTSNTALVSESVRSGMVKRRKNVMWSLPHDPFSVDELQGFQELCLRVPENPGNYGWLGSHDKGSNWQKGEQGGLMLTLYNHALPPNSPTCVNGTSIDLGISPPSSDHSNQGVNLLYCDGHVGHVSDDVDPVVWQYLGSRNDTSELVLLER